MTIPIPATSSMADYLAAPGLSSTGLVYFSESMAKGRAYEQGHLKFDTSSTRLGTAVHAVLTGNEDDLVAKPEHINMRTNAGKAEMAELELANVGKTIIANGEFQAARRIAESFYTVSDPLIDIIRRSPSQHEVNRFWHESGIDMKARADRVVDVDSEGCDELHYRWPGLFKYPFGTRLVVDYKTTSKSITPQSWRWTVRQYRYDLKAAHYLAGFSEATAFAWIAIETNYPYQVAAYLMSPSTAVLMAAERQEVLAKIVDARAAGTYPPFTPTNEEVLI